MCGFNGDERQYHFDGGKTHHVPPPLWNTLMFDAETEQMILYRILAEHGCPRPHGRTTRLWP